MQTVGEDMYKETFRQLYHGTTYENCNEIVKNGFILSTAIGNWCGAGVYFYDIKAKAWWASERKCREIKNQTGRSYKGAVVIADTIELSKESIFDLRTYKDLCAFQKFVEALLVEKNKWSLLEGGQEVSQERIVMRSILISFYAETYGKKLVVGHFMQLPNNNNNNIIPFANDMNLAFGIETIYCVKDIDIISNIR